MKDIGEIIDGAVLTYNTEGISLRTLFDRVLSARDDEWRALQAADFEATRERCAVAAESAAWGGPMSTMTASEAASKIRALPAAVPGERT